MKQNAGWIVAGILGLVLVTGGVVMMSKGGSHDSAQANAPVVPAVAPSANSAALPPTAPNFSVNPAAQPATRAMPATAPALNAGEDLSSSPVAASTPPEPKPAAEVSGNYSALAMAIQRAINNNSYQCTPIQGGAFAKYPFQEVMQGGVLIGFRIGVKKFFDKDIISSIQAIYSTPSGEKLGKRYGADAERTVRIKAPPGYAVGAATIRGGGGLDAITLNFMRIKGTRLLPNDGCVTPRIGGPGGGEMYVGGDGTPIIGYCGRQDEEGKWLGIGLIFLSHTPAAKPH